jgi:hypothetical protein
MSDATSFVIFFGGLGIFIAAMFQLREYLRWRKANREFVWRPDPRIASPTNPAETPADTDLREISRRLSRDAEALRERVDALEVTPPNQRPNLRAQ